MSELAVGSLKGLAANGFVIDVASGSKLVQPGSVLQVVSTTKTDTFTTSSTSFVDVTGLTASITPSATANKVLVSVSVPRGMSATNQTVMLTLTDGSNNNLINAASPGSRIPAFDADFISGNEIGGMAVQSFTFLHAPATTSAFTYKVRMRVTGGTAHVNRADQGDVDNNNQRGRGVATVTLMEIAG